MTQYQTQVSASRPLCPLVLYFIVTTKLLIFTDQQSMGGLIKMRQLLAYRLG